MIEDDVVVAAVAAVHSGGVNHSMDAPQSRPNILDGNACMSMDAPPLYVK